MEDPQIQAESTTQVVGIMVTVTETEGGFVIKPEMVGGFSPLSAPSVLELATQAARGQLGLAKT